MKTHGFTLLEVLVAISIGTGVLTMVTFFALDITHMGTSYGQNIASLQKTNLTFKIMNNELLGATQSVWGSYPIFAVSPTSITFYSDSDAAGASDQIRYFLNGSTLQKGVIHPSGNPLGYDVPSETITDLLNFVIISGNPTIFSYYDDTYTGDQPPLTYPIDISKIRMIRIDVTTDEDSLTEPGPVTTTLYTTIRNLRLQ